MKRNLNILFFLWVMVITGCKEDEKISYKPIPEIGIGALPNNSFTIAQKDTLTISPDVNGLEVDKQYEYEWKLFDNGKETILSTAKDLHVSIDFPSGSNYGFVFSVKDVATGVKSISPLYSLRVTGAFPEGWLVGNNIGSKGQLSFIRTMDDRVFLQPLDEINQTSYNSKLTYVKSGVILDIFGSGFKQLLYFTVDGLRVFDPETMLQISENNEYFYDQKQFLSKPGYGTNYYNMDQYLVHNGNLYAANGPGFAGNTNFGKFSDRFEGDYELFPYVFRDNFSFAYFYDNKHKRFVSASYNTRELTYPTSQAGMYKLDAVGKTMVAADYTIGGPWGAHDFIGLMRDEGNAYYVYLYKFYTNIGQGEFYSLKNAEEIEQMTAFAGATNSARAYYSSKNKIYKISGANGAVEHIYTLKDAGDIVDVQMLRDGDDADYMLAVAVNNGTQGRVVYLYLDDFGNTDNTRKEKIFNGFGQITNISYRNPS
ncbi:MULTISPECIES: PKD-like family lipoprotein [Sphingobacterium]|uniref:PKD-like family protein n=2 Tax=Sphingobacterium TaxID=28453 RepID=U2HU25_9SPHI|nr:MULTISPECIES: PKD-like family lipoprotein [Sphingobacterium]ERJ59012.1 hypothetical protein M472_09540 [Sphingobacterium paucimobilis HER1398]TDQ79213.1 PKD family protein [Sphingobacterium yanglingense]